jgi:hypothetical protein
VRSFVLYGLDLDDNVLAAEALSADGMEAARRAARERLAQFPKVELWDGAVCVYRNRRPPPPDPRAGERPA